MIVKRQFIDCDNRQLYAIINLPEHDYSEFVICFHPLFEEKKLSHRFFVELAGKLAAQNKASILFDLSGCGDSSGTMADAIFTDWQADSQAIVSFLKSNYPNIHFSLLAVRFGAIPALHLAQTLQPLKKIALIDPVTDFTSYLHEQLQQKLVREMMTFGESRTESVDSLLAQLDAGKTIDLDGTELTPALCESLADFNLSQLQVSALPEIMLIQQTAQGILTAAGNQLLDSLNAMGLPTSIECLKCPPFWKLFDQKAVGTTINSTANWL